MSSILEDLQAALSFGPKITFKPAEGAPSIYADPTDWADYRQKQAAEKSFQNRPTPQQIEQSVVVPPSNATDVDKQASANELSMAIEQLTGAGAGRGFENPAPVDPNAPAPNTVQGQDIIDRSFPEAFRKSPPTGKVNTEGGVDRVNARTEEHGVTATVGADGRIFMSNVGANGKVNPSTGSPNSIGGNGRGTANAVAPNLPLGLSSAMSQLGKSNDPNEARGLMENIVQGIAQAQAKLNQEALQFGATKANVGDLTAQLAESEAADRNDPAWYPGIGDSPITAGIRVQISQANAQARGLAEEYLNTNVNQASLKAYADSAKQEYQRIAKIQDKNLMADAQQQSQTAAKKALKAETAEEVASNLSPEEKKRITILAPQTQGDTIQMGEWFIQRSKASKGKLDQILAATPEELVIYAMEKDTNALRLLAAEEGSTPDEIDQRVKRIRENAESLDFDEKRIAFQTKGLPESQRKEQMKSMRMDQFAKKTTAGSKAEVQKQNWRYALEMERAAQTKAVVDDFTKLIPITDPRLGPAIKEAQKITGNKSLDSVLTAYVGSTIGEERMKRVTSFNKIMNDSVSSLPPSVFGVPDINVLKANMIQLVRQPGILDRIELERQKYQAEYPNVYKTIGDPIGTTVDTFIKKPVQGAIDIFSDKPMSLE